MFSKTLANMYTNLESSVENSKTSSANSRRHFNPKIKIITREDNHDAHKIFFGNKTTLFRGGLSLLSVLIQVKIFLFYSFITKQSNVLGCDVHC